MSKFLLAFSCAFLLVSPLSGALDEVPGGGSFSADSVLFDFSGPAESAKAAHVVSKWGVTFEEGDWGAPVIIQEVVLGFVNNSVLNTPETGTSADRPLILNFAYPASQVGFRLANGSAGTVVTIQAFGPDGVDLGTVTHNGLAEPASIAVTTDSADGIAKLLISYGAEEAAEQLDDLHIDYVSRPVFEIYLAQVGDGAVPGVGSFRTTIVVSNLSNSTADAELEFFSSNGSPLEVSDGDVEGSSFPRTILRGGSFTFATSGDSDPLGVGYARITSNVPVEATAIFGIVADSGQIITEAGVGSAEGKGVLVGAVLKRVEGNLDSGIAVVNTSGETADAALELYDSQGRRVGGNDTFASLGPGEHSAAFLSQIFPSVADQDFRGTIRLVSTVPLAAVILRTVNGRVLSSLPVGTLE